MPLECEGDHMRVLAFEDGANIALLLAEGGIELHGMELLQHWDTVDYLQRIEDFAPSILLLDHYIPPTKGLDVLRSLIAAVNTGRIERPEVIIAMSSLASANEKMRQEGVDQGIVKPALATLEIWPRRQS